MHALMLSRGVNKIEICFNLRLILFQVVVLINIRLPV